MVEICRKGICSHIHIRGAVPIELARDSRPLRAADMTAILRQHLGRAGMSTEVSMHSFRVGNAVAQGLAGQGTASIIMQRVC